MKRIISLIIVLSMILSCTCTIFAEDINKDKMIAVESISFSNEMVNKLSQIPIFMTYINDNNRSNLDYIKESVSLELKNAKKAVINDNIKNEQLKIVKNEYTISEINDSAKADIISNPLYSSTFLRAQDLIEQGITVSNINFFVNEPNMMASVNNTDDPAYWEANNTLLGTYDGYKFLFYESSMGVETKNWVTPGNISPSLKWDAIAKKSLETVLDHYVKDTFVGQVRASLNTLSSFFNMFDAPLAVTYGSSQGYLKAKVSGDLYMRTIYIQDKLDRISGYAYYQWGTTEQFKAKLKLDAKWPIAVRPGGTTYDYDTKAYTLSQQTISQTPGFKGNTTLYSSIISLYKNNTGYFQHNERIDYMTMIANLLS